MTLVGGSDAAAWKVKLLSATEAIVDVLAVDPVSTLRAAASESPHAPVRLHERAWRPKNLEGADLKFKRIQRSTRAGSRDLYPLMV